MNGLQPGSQGMDRCNGRSCDRVEAVDTATGQSRTFHFDTTLPLVQLERSLGGGGKKP